MPHGNYQPAGYNNYNNPFLQVEENVQYINSQQNTENTSPVQSRPSTSSGSSGSQQASPDETPKTKKKSYDKWTNEEQKMLVSLWAERHDEIDSKDSRKTWDSITTAINTKFNLQRPTDKYKKKMSYLIDRYKIAKDWNKKQTGGHRRESPFFKEIDEVLGCRDVVTLNHVADLEAGACVASTTSDSDENSEAAEAVRKEDRTERKKSKKRKRTEAKDDEEREMLRTSFEGLNEQRKNMNSFIENFTKMQEQQSQTMNALVGALTGFLKNNSK